MLDALGWLSIRQRIKMNVLMLIFKIKNGLAPEYLIDEVKYVGQENNLNVRNANDFRLPNFKSQITRKVKEQIPI